MLRGMISGLFMLCAALALPQPLRAEADFAGLTPPPAPDYAKSSSWAARPERPGAAAARPAKSKPSGSLRRADVFFVHPSTFKNPERWNQDISDAQTNAWTDESVIARQAGVFNGCCRVYAPRYRQAELRAFSSMQGDGGRAYDLAYEDVLRAFDYYIRHDNKGRPFILAGHSQGGLHVFRLLRDRIVGTALSRQLIAAYDVGYSLSDAVFAGPLKSLSVCARPDQTGCILAWNSFEEGSDTRAFAARSRAPQPGQSGAAGSEARLICTNPIELDGTGRKVGQGVLGPSKGLVLPPLVAGAVTATCDPDGVLKVRLDPAIALPPLPGGNMHYHDFALFYRDISTDAARRVAAWHKRH